MHKRRAIIAVAAFACSGVGVAVVATPASAACNTTDVIAIETVLAHFGQVESARSGRHDGLIGRSDLTAVANNSRADAALRHSARLVAENRLFNQLDTAARGGRADGLIGRNDLRAGCR